MQCVGEVHPFFEKIERFGDYLGILDGDPRQPDYAFQRSEHSRRIQLVAEAQNPFRLE